MEAIDTVGRKRYPNESPHGCDRSKTLLDIVRAGIDAVSDGTVVLPVGVPSDKSVKQPVSDDLDERITKTVRRETETLATAIEELRGKLLA